MLRPFALTIALAAVLLAADACGGDDSATETPSPTPLGEIGSAAAQVSGAVSGELGDDALSFCHEYNGSYQIALTGAIDGGQIDVSLGSASSGSFNYAEAASGLAITAKYTPTSGEVSNFAGDAGAEGVDGDVTIAAAGSGTMEVTIPNSGDGDALSVNATWTCP